MNDIEQAINQFVEFKSMGYGSSYLPSSLSVEVAITALQEKLTRESGCAGGGNGMSEQRLICAKVLMEAIKSNDYMLVDICNTKDFGMYTIGIQQAVDEQPTIEPTAPQWISIEDGLPEEKASVLVAYIGCNDKKVYADGCAKLDDGWRWTLDDSDVEVEITHWMPLPEPPREEKA